MAVQPSAVFQDQFEAQLRLSLRLVWNSLRKMNRRRFLKLSACAAVTLGPATLSAEPIRREGAARATIANRLEAFEYRGVRLLPSPFLDRLTATRAFYFGLPDNDIVKGFREQAGLPAPGEHLGGWCAHSSALLFGQWLSGMARLYRATGDEALRAKAIHLLEAWGETLPKLTFNHYEYDKFVCGLVDLAQYGNCPEALPLLARVTDWAEAHLQRERLHATDADSQGGYFNGQMEWYTLPENLYRAYLLTGDDRYRKFGDVWRYDYYWGMFNGRTLGTPDGFHGYSHVNTLSSAAMTYAVTGQPEYLRTITNAYDYFQQTQCYATGGYGPGEKLMRPNGELGESIVVEPNAKYLGGDKGRSFETPCGTWAVFKLCRYLQQLTGAARYGDWTERVLYNGIGAALPMRGRGETFYYADYRLTGARKYYYPAAFPCCAGTYIQDVADIHNQLYFRNPDGLFVNLYVPSEVTWQQHGQTTKLTQVTDYPAAEGIRFDLELQHSAMFNLNFRLPAWATDVSLAVNGAPHKASTRPGQWLELRRIWRDGDRVELRLPLPPRQVAIDRHHPRRVVWVRGPLVMVRPGGAEAAPGKAGETTSLVPFAQLGRDEPYSMYFDL